MILCNAKHILEVNAFSAMSKYQCVLYILDLAVDIEFAKQDSIFNLQYMIHKEFSVQLSSTK